MLADFLRNTMMLRVRGVPALVLICLMVGPIVGLSASAKGDPVLDFHVQFPANPGTVSYEGGAAAVIGSNIKLDTLAGFDTPLHDSSVDGPLALTGATLNFSSGLFDRVEGTTTYFGSGGDFLITGGIADLGIAAGSILLQGTVESTELLASGRIIVQTFVNQINAVIATYFGLPVGTVDGDGLGTFPYIGALNLSLVSYKTDSSKAAGNFSAKAGSGDVMTSPTPEPTTLAIACLGIAMIAGHRWRKQRTFQGVRIAA